MDAAQHWRDLFANWPSTMPRQGLVTTTSGDVIAFVNFMTSDGILLLERERPDSNDARKVMLAYSSITGLKSSTTMELSKFKAMGFK